MTKHRITSEPLLAGTLLEAQIELEIDAIHEGVKRYRRLVQEATERSEAAALKPAERLMVHWFHPLAEAIKREQSECRRNIVSPGREVFGPVMVLLHRHQYAYITIYTILNQCLADPSGVLMQHAAYRIGQACIAEAHLIMLKRHFRNLKEQAAEDERVPTLNDLTKYIRHINPMHVNRWAKKTLEDPIWSYGVCIHLGVRLIWLLIGIASTRGYDEDFNLAFHVERRRIGKKTPRYLVVDPEVLQLMEQGHFLREMLRPRYLPMIVPPFRWSENAEGGYTRIRKPYVLKVADAQTDALEAADLGHAHRCLNAVNVTPWRPNRRVLAVMEEFWERGGGDLGVPHRENFPMPPRIPDEEWADETKRRSAKEQAFAVHTQNQKLLGVRTQFIQKLAVANRFLDYDAIWFPHSFDFRSRTYPLPLFLHHHGDDVCRGLLEFAEAKEPGDQGSLWLDVHAANCYGVDKCSLAERVQWVEAHADEIGESLNDPFGYTFWQQADKPWQFLAACYALADDDAAAHIPTQQDGKCNGLQHYAAMGRDEQAARAVSLTPADEPADIYTDVVNVTKELVAGDATKGKANAVALLPFIERNVVKQTVMTTVYGVTMIGARKQIHKKLKKAGFADEQLYAASKYLSRLVLMAMRETAPKAVEIMDWLKRCARLIVNKPTKQAVSWTTPIGFPVVQPYQISHSRAIRTIMGDFRIPRGTADDPPRRGRQCNGVAPNFVHSVDATHMLLTALACETAGVTFAAVHDSFWTHAATGNDLAVILRNEFVALHERNLLVDLHEQWSRRYPFVLFPDPPDQGNFDISQIKNSVYAFS